MQPLTFQIPDEYPYTVLGCLILSFMSILIGFVTVGARRKVYTAAHMKKFQEEHEAAFGPLVKLGKGGYPDNGNGFYSQKIPYKAWLEYNNAVRVH